MKEDENRLVEPLLKQGNVFKLKCDGCNSISVQITENKEPDLMCFECGGRCNIFK